MTRSQWKAQAFQKVQADPNYLNTLLANPDTRSMFALALFEAYQENKAIPPSPIFQALPQEQRNILTQELPKLTKQAEELLGGKQPGPPIPPGFPKPGGEYKPEERKKGIEAGPTKEMIEEAQRILGIEQPQPQAELRVPEKPLLRKEQRKREEAAIILAGGRTPAEARVTEWIRSKLPKGIKPSEEYDFWKKEYRDDLLALAQTDLDKFSEKDWQGFIEERFPYSTKEELITLKQSLLDPTLSGHAGEFAKAFYQAHPAGAIARYLQVRPDAFQAAWDEAYTALHKEAAIAGGLTGMAWSWATIHQMIKETMVSPAVKDAFKAIESQKATPVEKQIVADFLDRRMVDLMYRYVETERLPNMAKQIGKSLEKYGWVKRVDPTTKVVTWTSPDKSMTFPNMEYWGVITEKTKTPAMLGMEGAGGLKPPPVAPTGGPLVPMKGGAIDINKQLLDMLVPKTGFVPPVTMPPEVPVVSEEKPPSIIHEAMKLYNNDNFLRYTPPIERWNQAKALVSEGKTELEKASADAILQILEEKGEVNKALLVEQFGEEDVNALVEEGMLEPKVRTKAKMPGRFAYAPKEVYQTLRLTDKAKEFMQRAEVPRTRTPAEWVMTEDDLKQMRIENQQALDADRISIVSGGGKPPVQPPRLPSGEAWRRKANTFHQMVWNGYWSIEVLDRMQRSTGLMLDYSQLSKAGLDGPGLAHITEQLDIGAYPQVENEALDYVMAYAIRHGRYASPYKTARYLTKPKKGERQKALQWAKETMNREQRVHDALQQVRGTKLTPDKAKERMGLDIYYEAELKGWIEEIDGKVTLTKKGLMRREVLPNVKKSLGEVKKINYVWGWGEPGKNINALLKMMEGAGGMSDMFLEKHTMAINPQTGWPVYTGKGFKPILRDFVRQGGKRRDLSQYLKAMSVLDRYEFGESKIREAYTHSKFSGSYEEWLQTSQGQKAVGKNRRVSPELAENQAQIVEGFKQREDFPLIQSTAEEIQAFGRRTLEALHPGPAEMRRLLAAHPHYVPLFVPTPDGRYVDIDDFTTSILQDAVAEGERLRPQKTILKHQEKQGVIILDPLEAWPELLPRYAQFARMRDIQAVILDNIDSSPIWQKHFQEVPKKKPDSKKWSYIGIYDPQVEKTRYFKVAPDIKMSMRLVAGHHWGQNNVVFKLLGKTIGKTVKWLTRAVTTYNPFFAINNLSRDQQQIWMNMRKNYVPVVSMFEGIVEIVKDEFVRAGKAIDYSKSPEASIVDSFRFLGGGLGTRAEAILGHREMQDIGHSISTAVINLTEALSSPESFMEFARTQFKKITPKKTLKGIAKTLISPIAIPAKTFALISHASELGSRITAYGTGIKRGLDPLSAYQEMRDAGTNFARAMSSPILAWSRHFVPFIGPRMVGLMTRVYKLSDPVERTTAWTRLAETIPFMLIAILAAMATKEYHNLPYDRRMRRFHIPWFKWDKKKQRFEYKKLVSFPKGREDISILWNGLEAIMNHLAYKDPDIWKSWLRRAWGEIWEGGLPLWAEIALEYQTGYDTYYQRYIEPRGTEELPSFMHYNKYTSETAMKAGELAYRYLRPVFGDKKWMEPVVMEWFFLTFTGTAGQKLWFPVADWLFISTGIIQPDATRPQSIASDYNPINVRQPSFWSFQSIKSLVDDRNDLLQVEKAVKKKYEYLADKPLSFQTKPANPSGKLHYFEDLWVVIREDGTEEKYYQGIPFTLGKDALAVDANALAQMSNGDMLIKLFEDNPSLLQIPERMIFDARWKQVDALAEMYKKINTVSDRTLLGPDLKGRDPTDPNQMAFFQDYPEVVDFYTYMKVKHPMIPIENYGDFSKGRTRKYIAEWKRFEEERLSAMAAIIAEMAHYEYQYMFKPQEGLDVPQALSAVDASLAEYEQKFGEYDPLFQKRVRQFLGQYIIPTTGEIIKDLGVKYPFMYNPETIQGVEPVSGLKLLFEPKEVQ